MTRARPGTVDLRPAEGRRVSHRDGRLFAAAGETIKPSPFYQRLYAAGDLELVPHGVARKSKTVPKLPEGKAP